MAFRKKSNAEKAMEKLPTLTPTEWAELAILCLDQAGCSETFQQRMQRVIGAELWLAGNLE
jgi:hypothetical protein